MSSAWPALKSGLLSALGSNKDEVDDKIYLAAKSRAELIPGTRSKEFIDWFLPLLNKHKSDGGYILDVGTANGHDAAWLSDMGYNLVAADHNPEMINTCKKNRQVLIDSGSAINWEMLVSDMVGLKENVALAKDLPQVYDSVVCLGTLMFLLEEEDIQKTFQCFADLLRPGGALILDFRNFQSVLERGYVVKNGAHPGCTILVADESQPSKMIDRIEPYVLYGPGKVPLSAYMNYCWADGSASPLLFKPLTVDLICSVAKKTFGDNCEIKVYHDFQTDHPDPVEAAWLFFYIRKSD